MKQGAQRFFATARRIAIYASFVLAASLSVSCGDDGDGCSAGDFRCNGNVSEICNAGVYGNHWEAYQNCGSIGERCSTAPAKCSGYSGIACCY